MSVRRFTSFALVAAFIALATLPANSEPVAKARPEAPATARSPRASEAAFLRTVDRQNTANVVTGDLVHFAGTHVAYVCDVDKVVSPGLILGQCGSDAEPMDLFIHLSTAGIRSGQRLRILGVMENPAMWTDINGHTVYYAFVKALFVHPS